MLSTLSLRLQGGGSRESLRHFIVPLANHENASQQRRCVLIHLF